MGFLDRFRRKKRPPEFELAVTSNTKDERMFTIRDIEITVKRLPAHTGIASVYFRGGSEEARDALSTVFLTRLPQRDSEMRYNHSSYDATDHETYITFRHPDMESLAGLPKQLPGQPPVITFEVLCHAAESLERQYKGRILGES